MTEITFDNSRKEASAFGLTQWDKGQKLKIIWEDMPEKFQVHFSSRGSSEAVVTEGKKENGEAIVDIPDSLLKNSADIIMWIYVSDSLNKVGESLKRGVLYVRPRAKPHTAMDDLDVSQQELLESILGDINENINHIKSEGTESEYFPEYVKTQAENVAKKVIEHCNENTVVFLAASDAHLKNGDYNSETAIRHMSQAMKLISQSCPIDFAVYLGDMTSAGSDKAITDALSEMMRVNSSLKEAGYDSLSLRCTGSDDSLSKSYYRNGDFISTETLYNLIFRWNKDVVRPEESKVRGYCYKDFESEKIRVICLNTSDTYGKKLLPSAETATMSTAQLQWMCEALDLSDKSDTSDWRIILLGHHPLDMLNKFPLALQVIEAYVNGGDVDIITSDGGRLAYDFAGKNSAVILGQFHGHLHNYRVNFITEKKIPLVAIPNAGFYDNNFYKGPSFTNAQNTAYSEVKTYNKTVNSATDTAFCVVVLDKVTGEIYAVHYGAGVDRTISGTEIWEDSGTDTDSGNGSEEGGSDNTEGEEGGSGGADYEYTNLVPLSKTETGNTYSSSGYMNNNSLSSTNELVYKKSYTHTGYIQAIADDVVRVSGATFDGTAGNYLLVFNRYHELIWLVTLTGENDAQSGIAYTTSGILVFKPSDVQTGALANMHYFRVSAKASGSDLIVTVNEDIDGSSIREDIGSPVVSYTNIVQYAQDKYGNVFDENGSKNNCRLNASGDTVTASGYTAVGYLEADTNAVIRVKGISFDGKDGSYLCLYDSDYSLVSAILIKDKNDTANGISYEGAIMKFTPAEATNDFSNMTYFRVSGIGSDTNLVITYCEEIN